MPIKWLCATVCVDLTTNTGEKSSCEEPVLGIGDSSELDSDDGESSLTSERDVGEPMSDNLSNSDEGSGYLDDSDQEPSGQSTTSDFEPLSDSDSELRESLSMEDPSSGNSTIVSRAMDLFFRLQCCLFLSSPKA